MKIFATLLFFLSLVAPASAAADLPKPVQAMQAQGFEVLAEFDAPAGLRGFAGVAGQSPLTVYATADGSHALVGTLVNAEGIDVGAAAVQEHVLKPLAERSWARLADSTWVADGSADAARIVYTFSDANCPYCNSFWRAARPWVDAGKVQLRHVIVGVIREDSANKAASILTAADPSAALLQNENGFNDGGIKPAASVSAKVRGQLDANQALMQEMGFRGTPGIAWLDAQGMLQRHPGMPSDSDLEAMFGPR